MTADNRHVAVVTGGTRGIGFAIAEELVRSGIRLGIVARDQEALRTAERRLKGAVGFRCDVSDPDAVLILRDAIAARMGSPDILINNAGTYAPISLIVESKPSEWIGAIGVNLIGPYLTCRAFVPAMIEAGWGRVVNVTSIASVIPPVPTSSSYAASKAALNYLTRTLATELEGTGVTANVIHPGEVKTAMWRQIATTAVGGGHEVESLREWARDVEETGGDPPEKAARLVRDCIDDGSINGRFLWIAGGLLGTVPTW